MKKINKNLMIFIVCTIIIILGMISKSFIRELCLSGYRFIKGDASFTQLVSEIEKISSEKLSYHNNLMDLNSLIMRISGTQYVEKTDGSIVARMDNDYLSYKCGYIEDAEIEKYAANVRNLYNASKENNAGFLYVVAPQKGYGNVYPAGVDNYCKSNYDRFVEQLDNKNVPFINLREHMNKEAITDEELFFVTDHHWKPTSGFWAFTKICDELKNRYGFEYDEKCVNLSNFNLKTYDDYFLGSQGKKVGQYFTPFGADDFDLITPKFETSLTEEQPLKNEIRSGDFSETIMYMNHAEGKELYTKIPYDAYSGGDFRLQIVTNHLSSNDDKVLIIRDSFACVVAPFLSLTAKQTYIVDIREGDYYVGDRIESVSDYIAEIKPDYVIVLYSDFVRGRFDFN